MFKDAESFNINLSEWNVGVAVDMDYMFTDASSFAHVLCWNVSGSTTSMFSGSSGGIDSTC